MKRKRKRFLALNNRIFENPKNRFFSKGVNPCFWSKNANYLVYLDLVKIRPEIMLSNFPEKIKNIFDHKKHNFSKSKKSYFSKGLTHAFHTQNANYFLYLPLIKISLEKMHSDFTEKKKPFFSLSKTEFFKNQKIAFFKRVNSCF